jgi:hypothetical protein
MILQNFFKFNKVVNSELKVVNSELNLVQILDIKSADDLNLTLSDKVVNSELSDIFTTLDIKSADNLKLTLSNKVFLNSILSINNLSSEDLVQKRASCIKLFINACYREENKIKENIKRTEEESFELEEEEELLLEKQLDREVILAEFTAKQEKLLEKYTSLCKKLNQTINKTAFVVEIAGRDYRNIKNEHWRFIYKNIICR